MPSPATARDLLGHFLCGIEPPAADQCASPHPSGCQHIRPFGQYWRPGPGEEARGAARADVRSEGRRKWGLGSRGENQGQMRGEAKKGRGSERDDICEIYNGNGAKREGKSNVRRDSDNK